MKILFSNAIIVLLALSFVSCTEEIADEVQNKADLTEDSNGISDYSTRSIRLVHKMDEGLSFLMHKSGNAEADCELQAPTAGFDADDYDYTSATYNVDCVLDVEELDLKSNGVSFELQIDDYLCEYIDYTPYRFLRFQPGRTSRTVYQVTCDTLCSADATYSSRCDKYYDDYTFVGTPATDTPSNQITDFENNACFFDYSKINSSDDWGYYPNCDEGDYSIVTIEYTVNDNGTPNDTSDDTCGVSANTGSGDPIECGGDYNACIGGAAKDEFGADDTYHEIYNNSDLEEFSKTWSYSSQINDEEYPWSNIKLANYSRICAETSTNKVSGDVLTGTGSAGNFSTIVLDGAEVEDIRLANGIGDGKTYKNDVATTERIYAADNLFRGVIATTPYYSFKCLDKAYDVKAQIRLFIRDWDRKFEHTNTYISYTSDTFITSPLMDSGFTKQSTYDYWNDFADLDDFLEQDTDDDYEVDTYIMSSNKCEDSSTPFNYGTPSSRNYGNFPGVGGLSQGQYIQY